MIILLNLRICKQFCRLIHDRASLLYYPLELDRSLHQIPYCYLVQPIKCQRIEIVRPIRFPVHIMPSKYPPPREILIFTQPIR